MRPPHKNWRTTMDHRREEKLKMLNVRKREFLINRFGMMAYGTSPEVPPEIEGKQLDKVAEIELACATAGEVTVREYLGNPQLKQLSEVSPDRLKPELERIEDLLQKNNIMFVPGEELSDSERYRVLVNELPEQKIENVRFPIWYAVFMYIPFLGFKRIGISMDAIDPAVLDGRKGRR
jgi:hypothetical protein